MAVLFTSDTHFGHAGAIGRWRRPFASVAEMDAAMERLWNEAVAPGDTVWHLGDVAVRRPAAWVGSLLDRLNGTKHLVAGNNDPPEVRALPQWASARDYAEIEEGGLRLVLCHYALRTWNGMGRGAWNLHGHSHGALSPATRQRDVGADVWGFRPARLEDVTASGRNRRRASGIPGPLGG